jgi:hypothetical protein
MPDDTENMRSDPAETDCAVVELCHVVHDIDAAMAHWIEFMGAGPFFVFDVDEPDSVQYRGQPGDSAIRIGFAFSGELLIELITPLRDTPSVFKEVLDSRGEGYHHVMLGMDYQLGWDKLSAAGFEPALQGQLPDGSRYVLFDTVAANGGFTELMERTPGFYHLMSAMRDAHVDWDRKTNPVRSLAEIAG